MSVSRQKYTHITNNVILIEINNRYTEWMNEWMFNDTPAHKKSVIRCQTNGITLKNMYRPILKIHKVIKIV